MKQQFKFDKPQLLLPFDYLKTATALVNSARQHIYLIGLNITEDQTTEEFISALVAAARRGVEVHVAADFMTFVYATMKHRRLPLTYHSRSVRNPTQLAKRLTEAGVHFRWLGQYYGPLFMSRTHSKWCVIDKSVFSFGGVNIEKSAFVDNIDYMFGFNDQALAAILINEHLRIEKADRAHRTSGNHRLTTKFGSVIIDGGIMGQSAIYRRVRQLSKQASQILLVSQYCPTGRLAKVLQQKSAELYFNRLDNADLRLNRLMIRLGRRPNRSRNLYAGQGYLHAKFMIFTMPDGRKTAVTGSHNFVAAGSRFGTREIALETDSPIIIKQLEKFFRQHVKTVS
jgi:cardiolipin synthase